MPYQQLQFRRGTAAQWTAANPVLAAGEMGLETDTTKFKVGDGTTAWNSLSYGPIAGVAADNTITAAKLTTDAVTTAKIQNNAVTQAKLASTLSGVTICTSSTKPGSPFDGQVIYMTDVDQSAVWDGSAWVGLDPSRDRNVIINGAMQVAQRGTSTASITTTGIYTADRWDLPVSTNGTWTESVEVDGPTGSGFVKSLKLLCTTASSPAGGLIFVRQRLEGLNVQGFAKGTASAKPFTLSFWVKSNVTGTYIAELWDATNSRQVSASYTILASATWEKKTITFPADTVSAFANTNAAALDLHFYLSVSSSFTSGTLNTVWASAVTANRGVGQTNLAAATNNYWQVTGVQLEAGAVATPFEFEDYSTTLTKCERYFQKNASLIEVSYGGTANSYIFWQFRTPMRATPTVTNTGATTASATTLDMYYAYRTGGNNVQLAAGATAAIEL